MNVCITNAQRADPVNTARIRRLVRDAASQLAIHTRGRLDIMFLDARRMQELNKRFLHQNRSTDVLSFRYDAAPSAPGNGRPIVGEIFIAPSQARAYAKRHGLSYAEELSRYVLHGLLHWLGEEDATPAQQKRMRKLEDGLLKQCGTAGPAAAHPTSPPRPAVHESRGGRRAPPQFVGGSSAAGWVGASLRVTRR